MFKTLITAFALLCAIGSAEARSRVQPLHPECGRTMPCTPMAEQVMPNDNPFAGIRSIKVTMRRDRTSHRVISDRKNRHARKVLQHHPVQIASEYSKTIPSYVAGIVAPLAAKVAEIKSACGSVVTPHGGVRNTYVRGTRRISLHASGKAVDLAGNAPCIYSMLHGWPGGYSIDYSRVRHVHLSYDPQGREWGLRFAHRGHRTRYARHRHHRYAAVR